MSNTYSQASQDLFVTYLSNHKRNGYFLEIGTNHPITHNNSYILENQYGWRGILIEQDKSFEESYKIHRPNSVYFFDDARNIDYLQGLVANNFPDLIDYLQIDSDVKDKSAIEVLTLLDNTIFDKYTFNIVTFKTDIYAGDYFNTRKISREIFAKRGYILLYPDVSVFWEGSYKPFEDWYVHQSLLSPRILDQYISKISMKHHDVIDKMKSVKSVLFFNHHKVACGVYQYGKRVFDIIKYDKSISYLYFEIGSLSEYQNILAAYPNAEQIIYNYHGVTMPWLNNETIQRKIKNIAIVHESDDSIFDVVCNIDPDANKPNHNVANRYFNLPRPLFENIEEIVKKQSSNSVALEFINKYQETGLPIFGSFGFGFNFKGFDKIVKLINEKYEEAVIKLVIPHAHFDKNTETIHITERICNEYNVKPGIKLMISHDYFSDEDMIRFLHSNTMNIFMFDRLEGRGISSSLDYALSVKKPLGITNSFMFRHIYADEISLESNDLQKCIQNSKYCDKFIKKYSNDNMRKVFANIIKRKRGIFYNSTKAMCSIWESGYMCYEALKNSDQYTLDYTEDKTMHNEYDFAIFNQHFSVNNWMTEAMIKKFNKPTFCIVTEIFLNGVPHEKSPKYFDHYIILDPHVAENSKIHAFPRPIEGNPSVQYEAREIPIIGSFGFATYGKEWHRIVEETQNSFDKAKIHFNIPKATHVSDEIHNKLVTELKNKCKKILTKPGIELVITHNTMSKTELIDWCAKNTINCFFYFREHIYTCGLSAVTDQAISSGRPLLVTEDKTFRHIAKYIKVYPEISVKQAIEENQAGVLQMRKDWSRANFREKFENILILQ